MLLVLHSDSPHGMMGRSRWSDSRSPLYLTFMTRLFFRLCYCGPAEKGREGKGPLPAEQTWQRRPAEKGVPLPTVWLDSTPLATGNWRG